MRGSVHPNYIILHSHENEIALLYRYRHGRLFVINCLDRKIIVQNSVQCVLSFLYKQTKSTNAHKNIGVCFVKNYNIFPLLTVNSPKYWEWIKKMRMVSGEEERSVYFSHRCVWNPFHKHLFYNISCKKLKLFVSETNLLWVWCFEVLFYEETLCQSANNANKNPSTWRSSFKIAI